MFVLVFLLCILSIPTAFPKPNVAKSELGSKMEDDETRAKRHIKFLDLLHQAIEKYATTADIKLEPLKTIADYKKYETFTYPHQVSSNSAQATLGAHNLNSNRPNVTCRKINLCSIEQPSQTATGYKENSPYLGKPQDANINVGQQYQTSKIPTNTNQYSKIPSYANKLFGLKHMPAKLMSSLAPHNLAKYNFTYLPLNLATLSRFLYGPASSKKNFNMASSIHNPTGTKTPLDNELSNVYPTVPSNTCSCSMEKSKAYENAVAAVLGERIKTNCPCLEDGAPPKAEPNSILTSKAEKNLSPNEYEKAASYLRNEDLDSLLLQLEVIAEKGNKEDLKDILSKLKSLKSEIEVSEWNFNNKEASTLPATRTNNNQPMKDSKNEYTSITTTTNDGEYHYEIKTKPVNGQHNWADGNTNKKFTTVSSYKENENKYFTKNSIKSAYKQDNSQLPSISDEDISEESLESVTSSPALEIKITNAPPYVAGTDTGIKDFTYSIPHRNYPKDAQQNYDKKINDSKKKNNKNLSRTNAEMSTSGNRSKVKASKFIKNDSKITISISTNGRFKKIQVEQQLPEPHEKYLEINEKENMNMGSKSKKRPIDMMGTDSRYVKVLKQPRKSDSYPEPILSEIYPAKSKRKTRKPLVFYFNKIEENHHSGTKDNSNNFLKTFESIEYDDDDGDNHESNKAEKEGIDYENQADIHRSSESGVLT